MSYRNAGTEDALTLLQQGDQTRTVQWNDDNNFETKQHTLGLFSKGHIMGIEDAI